MLLPQEQRDHVNANVALWKHSCEAFVGLDSNGVILHLVAALEKLIQAHIELLVSTEPRFVDHFHQMLAVLATLQATHASLSVIPTTVATRKHFDIASLPEVIGVRFKKSLASLKADSGNAFGCFCISQVRFKLFANLGTRQLCCYCYWYGSCYSMCLLMTAGTGMVAVILGAHKLSRKKIKLYMHLHTIKYYTHQHTRVEK